MAFLQQQQRPLATRQASFPPTQSEQADTLSLASPLKRNLDESEEWVIFSPSQAPSVVQTATTSTERTPRTHALSRFSDFGSLDTAARSDHIEEEDDDDITEHGSDQDEEAELDSLDDGLHAFHEPDRIGIEVSGATVLPTHDGLGSFGDNSAAMQQQMWQFEQEQQASRRKLRRTSSVQRTLDALREADFAVEGDRTMRIEQWRLEQSRALLEEIERETRRMHKISRVNTARSTRSRATSRAGSMINGQTASEAPIASTVATLISEQPPTIMEEPTEIEGETESFWQKFTQKVIRSLIGIDENLLSIILGEDLVSEAPPTPVARRVEEVPSLEDRDAHVPIEDTWQHKLMVRIARELGVFVSQMSEHPGAFSTYKRTQEIPAYAGLPNTTMSAFCPAESSSTATKRKQQSGNSIMQSNEASLWGIEEESDDLLDHALREARPLTQAELISKHEQEYWEKDMDVKMVFNFLKDRFSSQSATSIMPSFASPAPSVVGGLPVPDMDTASAPTMADMGLRPSLPDRRASMMSTTSIPYSARRAALIRQHHPLTSRNADAANRRLSLQTQPFNTTSFQSLTTITTATASPADILSAQTISPLASRSRVGKSVRSAGSRSCASQSTRRSASGSARNSRPGRGGNFWDSHSNSGRSVGGGVGGGIGAWGEV